MSDIARRAEAMPPFIVMDVLERAQELERTGRSIIHMEIGEPDFDTPPPVVEAARKALADGITHYTHSLGLLPLREAVAQHYHTSYGVTVSPEQVVVTTGTSSALQLVLLALLNPGESVILTNPRYACYPNFISAAGGHWVDVPTCEAANFRLPLSEIGNCLEKVKGILINSPANPTGTVLSGEELRLLADTLYNRQGYQPYVISDEIYHGLTYGVTARSMLEFTDRTFVIDGFSKRYAMTGWRIGYVVVPPEFIRPVQKLQQNLFICANSFVQQAAITALHQGEPYVRQMVNEYDRRRNRLLQGLSEIGLPVRSTPAGAFYVFVNTAHIGRDSYRLAFDILEKAGVAVTPGIDFGSGGEGFIRLSYAASLTAIDEGVARLGAYLKQRL